ncbi:MAG: 5'-3' exonuclease H3TH domain-containing protein [Polyangiaceae bacterium]
MRLHVVDGTYELFRAHYSKRPDHTTPDGRPLKATLGVVSSMVALLQDAEEDVTHLAMAFDNPIRSFRNDLYDGYKTEDGIDPDLRAQFDPVEEAARALGIVVWSMDKYEADDALATATVKYAKGVSQIRILTPDKDLGQCVRGTKVVQVDRLRERVIDEDELRKTRGFGPESIPDWLALVGDTADGIPGLRGFGDKSTSALLAVYPHLEDVPKDASAWTPKIRGAEGLAATLREGKKEALLYRKLATVVTDVPLRESLADLRWKGVDVAAWSAFCAKVGASKDFRERAIRASDGR